ncbi:MAG: hypothetical protein RIR70_1584 [Pseudomonadota bacterium]|jgi:hypothetical protein
MGLITLGAVVAVLGIGGVFASPPRSPALWQLAVAVLVLATGVVCIRRAAFYAGPEAIIAVRPASYGVLEIQTRSGHIAPVVVAPDSTLLGPIMVLRLTHEDKKTRRALVVLPDALDVESQRVLRVWLRWMLF